MVGSNKVEDRYKDFDLSHHLDFSALVVVDNVVGEANGGSLAVDI